MTNYEKALILAIVLISLLISMGTGMYVVNIVERIETVEANLRTTKTEMYITRATANNAERILKGLVPQDWSFEYKSGLWEFALDWHRSKPPAIVWDPQHKAEALGWRVYVMEE